MSRTKKNIDIVSAAKEVTQVMEKYREPTAHRIDKSLLFPSGSTLLNLACSDSIFGAWLLGTIITIPGSSSGGKTMLAITALAQAFYSKKFLNHSFIYDDGEEALNFDMIYLFNTKFTKALELPPLGKSKTMQDFKANMLLLRKKGNPFIYVQDSLDSLTSDEELEKEMRKALAMAKSEEAAKKIAGSFGAEKAKIIGQILRMVNNAVKETNSLVIIVQQRRQKMNALPFVSPYTTSGGEAPFYWSSHQIWLNKRSNIKRRNRKIGTEITADVRKNKITGKLRTIDFNIFTDYGIDDIGSTIDFLIDEKIWNKPTGKKIITTNWENVEGERDKLTHIIEEKGLVQELKKEVGEVWKDIEDSLRLRRKPRF